MHIAPRARTALARHPVVFWALVALLAGGAALAITGDHRSVAAARRSWGEQRVVWVATAAAAPGEPLAAEPRRYPLAVVAPTAVRAVPSGAVAVRGVSAGEIIVAADIGTAGLSGLVPPGMVAILVGHDSPAVFSPGDTVVCLALGAELASGVVIATADGSVTVAVATADAAALAMAAIDGTVVLGLTAPVDSG